MANFLSKAVTWFQGKKTILGGILVIGAAVAGEWYGKIDPTTALAIGGIGFTAVGLGDKANRHQAQILTALQGIATAGADYRAGNAAGALKAVEGMAATIAPVAGVSLHISADSAGELASALQSISASSPAALKVASENKAALA